MFVGSSLSSIQMFKKIKLEDKNRFAIISTDKEDMVVKTSLAPGEDKKVAGSLPKKIQNMIFVVIDNTVVASFPDSFPNIYKDILLQVKVQYIFAMLFNFFHCESHRPWRVPTRLPMMLGSTTTSSPSWRSPTTTSRRTRSQTKEEGPGPKPRRSPSMT